MREGSIKVEIAIERVCAAADDLAEAAYRAAEWYNDWRIRHGLTPLSMPPKPKSLEAAE